MWLRILFLLLPLQLMAAPVPSLHDGRFRPLECTAKLWLYDLHHRQAVKDGPDAETLLWELHYHGHAAWDQEPLFWLHRADLKKALRLNPRADRFSYETLQAALDDSPELWKAMIIHEYLQQYFSPVNRGRAEMLELSSLSPGLWASLRNGSLVLVKNGGSAPWNQLSNGSILVESAQNLSPADGKALQPLVEEAGALLQKIRSYEGFSAQNPFRQQYQTLRRQGLRGSELQDALESSAPLYARLQQSGNDLRLLPSKQTPGDWLSLRALRTEVYDIKSDKLVPLGNFTPYSDKAFTAIREAYLSEDTERLKELLSDSYASLAGQSYRKARGKELSYPTMTQLEAELAYYRYPLIELSIAAYLLGSILMTLGYGRGGLAAMVVAFLIHSSVLALRCYILGRPPVSNMFETVIYVPWVTMLVAFVFHRVFRNRQFLIAAALASLALLLLLRLTNVSTAMENVQAVLDSQYWLTVHVLMIVASYGVFILCGVLAHLYLFPLILGRTVPQDRRDILVRGILQSMYLGTALLIPATILGGVWAAESWGRFWDWDPKESWAFISSCVYIIGIHLYRYNKVGPIGLAVGAVVGLMSISFTWYGVNYILGTGLHSYGFGSGGEGYYYLYLLAETLLILTVLSSAHLSSKKTCPGQSVG